MCAVEEHGGNRSGAFDADDVEADAVSELSAYTAASTAAVSTAMSTSTASGAVSTAVSARPAFRAKGKGKKDKRRKNKLRAGTEFEDRSLKEHILVALSFPVVASTTLEKVGMLTELLTALGHSGDAIVLQRVVGEYSAAHAAACEEVEGMCIADTDPGRRGDTVSSIPAAAAPATDRAGAKAAAWKWALLRTNDE